MNPSENPFTKPLHKTMKNLFYEAQNVEKNVLLTECARKRSGKGENVRI